jgi:DNA-binding transcriptional LysR family regulator
MLPFFPRKCAGSFSSLPTGPAFPEQRFNRVLDAMTDLQIDYFMAVARTSSFVKASERLYVSQPAISRQVSALEAELGVVLFDRSKRASRLTAAGELFYKFFLDYKNGLSATKYHAQAVNEKIGGAFRLGYLEGWALPDFFPDLLNVFKQEYPAIHISLYAWNLRELVEELEDGNLDLIIYPNLLESFSVNFAARQIVEIPHCLLYSVNSPKAKLKNPSLGDFKDYPFFVVDIFSSVINSVRGIVASYDINPANVVPVPNLETALARVYYDQGVIILNVWNRAQYNRSFGAIVLDIFQKISFTWLKRDTNKFIQIFIDAFSRNFTALADEVPKARNVTENSPPPFQNCAR